MVITKARSPLVGGRSDAESPGRQTAHETGGLAGFHRRFGNAAALDAAAGSVLSPELLTSIADLETDDTLSGPRLLRAARSGGAAPPGVGPVTVGGDPLPDGVRARMESVFGHDFGHVRLHRGAEASDAAQQLDAAALAVGAHVFFAPGTWAPGTAAGDRRIAHELAHVVQYDQGQVPDDGGVSAPADSLERSAESAADAAVGALAVASAPTHAGPPSAPSSAPQARVLCDRHPHTAAALEGYAVRLTALGLRGMDRAALAPLTGDPHDDALTESEIETAFTTLSEAGSGVARGWNGGQDDLGARQDEADHDRSYWTPLHYGLELHRLAIASGASGYGDYARNHAARTSLAGAPMRVHPRAVWFVAAAQLGMDRAAGMEDGEHYAAPSALTGATRRLQRTLSSIAGTPVARARRASLDRTLPERYRDARAELAEIQSLAELHQRRDVEADGAGEGREEPEAFAAWLLEPERQQAIAAVADPTDAATAIAAAGQLNGLLGGAPGRDHGMGAMDAHGTNHAMGLAIDYGTSGSSAAENRGVPDIAWPFLYRLMDDSGAPLAGQRPHAIHAMEHEDRAVLSDLVRGPAGQALHAHLTEEAPEATAVEGGPTAAERRELRHAVATAQAHARQALGDVVTRIGRIGRGVTAALRDEVTELRARIREDRRTMDSRSPRDIAALLDGYRPALEELDAHVREAYRADGADERAWLERRMTSDDAGTAPRGARASHPQGRSPEQQFDADVTAVETALARLDTARDTRLDSGGTAATASEARELSLGPAQQQWERDRGDALREQVREPAFRRWWRGASQTGIYSQPDAYVAGIESVHAHADGGPHFYGGHHWDIADQRIITHDGEYRASLDRDMSRRSADDIDRIAGIVAESDSGRQALDSDRILGAALEAHAPGWQGRRSAAGGPPG